MLSETAFLSMVIAWTRTRSESDSSEFRVGSPPVLIAIAKPEGTDVQPRTLPRQGSGYGKVNLFVTCIVAKPEGTDVQPRTQQKLGPVHVGLPSNVEKPEGTDAQPRTRPKKGPGMPSSIDM